jgi:hypothetical protein
MKCAKTLPQILVAKNWLLHHDNALFTSFHQGTFDQKQHDHRSPLHPTFLFVQLKTKLKGHHFDATEVIKAESQAVLNTLTEHDFHDAFKKWQRGGNGACVQKGITLRVMVANRPKVNF